MTTTTNNDVAEARRALANMRSFVRRTGLTGWVRERSAGYLYRRAFAAVVAVEDRLGVEDPTVVKLGDRLRALRWEASEAGLLTPTEVLEAEKSALGLD